MNQVQVCCRKTSQKLRDCNTNFYDFLKSLLKKVTKNKQQTPPLLLFTHVTSPWRPVTSAPPGLTAVRKGTNRTGGAFTDEFHTEMRTQGVWVWSCPLELVWAEMVDWAGTQFLVRSEQLIMSPHSPLWYDPSIRLLRFWKNNEKGSGPVSLETDLKMIKSSLW